MRALLPALLIGAIVAAAAPAQIGIGRIKTSNLPGDFFLPPGSINLTESLLSSFGNDGTGLIDFHGITRLPNGHYLLSQGRESSRFKKLFFELDSDGSFLSATEQPDEFSLSGRLGHTNLAWDRDQGPDSRVWGIRARAMRSYDWRAHTFDDVNVPTNLFIGLKSLDLFKGFEVRAATIAEVDGQKILVCADKKDVIMPFRESAKVNYYQVGTSLAVVPPLKPPTRDISPDLSPFDTGKLGAAFDPIHGTIWWHIDAGDTNPNPNLSATRFFEMDMDGDLTGQIIQGDRRIGGLALGCSMHVDADGNLVLAYMVDMGTPISGDNPLSIPFQHDVLVEMYASFGFGSSCGGTIGFDSEPYLGNLDWRVTLTDAPDNPTGFAFLMRGTGVPPPGFIIQIPGQPPITNCSMLISLLPFINTGVPLVNGEASFSRFIPEIPSLIDLEPTFQWLMPGSNGAVPLDLSNGGTIRIGTNL